MSEEKLLSLYEKRVVRKEGNECWPWKGSTNDHGYAIITHEGKRIRAHRLSYRVSVGELRDDEDVLHTCDNPPCTNPRHLFKGTQKDNMQDMIRKGRGGQQGDRNRLRMHPEQNPRPWINRPETIKRGDEHYTHKHPELVLHGDKHPMAKISQEQVEHIRERYAQGGITQRKLAAMHKISQGHVSGIVRGKKRKV